MWHEQRCVDCIVKAHSKHQRWAVKGLLSHLRFLLALVSSLSLPFSVRAFYTYHLRYFFVHVIPHFMVCVCTINNVIYIHVYMFAMQRRWVVSCLWMGTSFFIQRCVKWFMNLCMRMWQGVTVSYMAVALPTNSCIKKNEMMSSGESCKMFYILIACL